MVVHQLAMQLCELHNRFLKLLFGLGKRGHAAVFHDTSMAPDSAAMRTLIGTGTDRVV